MFFGWLADRCAWGMGQVAASNLQVKVSRGVPAAPSVPIRLTVRMAADGTAEGLAGDEVVCRMPCGAGDLGKVGFIAGRKSVRFAGAAVSAPADAIGPDGRTCAPPPDRMAVGASVWLQASDGFASVWREETWR